MWQQSTEIILLWEIPPPKKNPNKNTKTKQNQKNTTNKTKPKENNTQAKKPNYICEKSNTCTRYLSGLLMLTVTHMCKHSGVSVLTVTNIATEISLKDLG